MKKLFSAKKNIAMILAAALAFLSVLAGFSVAKYVITEKRELVGVYTDFVISHDGEGQTCVLQGQQDGTYVGYIAVTVNNFSGEKISKRDVMFSMREPTDAELAAGKVTDAWGNSYRLSDDSGKYEISIVNSAGEAYDEAELAALTKLKAKEKNQSSLLLKITRKSGFGALSDAEAEHISVILETSVPYRDLQIFHINAAATRLSVGVTKDVYKGYSEYIVNLKSSADFTSEKGILSFCKYKADIALSLEGNVIFDAYRFHEMYGDKTVLHGKTFEFEISPDADMYLYFYVSGECNVKMTGIIYDGEGQKEKISGVSEDDTVFAEVVS